LKSLIKNHALPLPPIFPPKSIYPFDIVSIT
jgi:hypothetical protein